MGACKLKPSKTIPMLISMPKNSDNWVAVLDNHLDK